jgi:hypothetical protein
VFDPDFIPSQESELPLIPEALVTRLDKLFPEQSADLKWTDREVWFRAGQRSVIRFLLQELEAQRSR